MPRCYRPCGGRCCAETLTSRGRDSYLMIYAIGRWSACRTRTLLPWPGGITARSVPTTPSTSPPHRLETARSSRPMDRFRERRDWMSSSITFTSANPAGGLSATDPVASDMPASGGPSRPGTRQREGPQQSILPWAESSSLTGCDVRIAREGRDGRTAGAQVWPANSFVLRGD